MTFHGKIQRFDFNPTLLCLFYTADWFVHEFADFPN